VSDPLTYVVGYVGTSQRDGGVTEHAVIDGTQTKRTVGYSAASLCGRSARLGMRPRAFDSASRTACRSCVRLINYPPQQQGATHA
jgi:hypothetical protein